MNQSVYLNGLVPVPFACCKKLAGTLSRSKSVTIDTLFDFINVCCTSYDIVSDDLHANSSKSADNFDKDIRKLFSCLNEAKPKGGAALTPSKHAVVLNCYGLGADGVEMNVKQLYKLP